MTEPSSSERMTVRAPASARVFTSWTTDDLETAEALCHGGNLQRAADLCWSMLGDGRVRAALETRVKGLLGLPITWEEAGDRRSSGRVAKALAGGDFVAAHSEAALCSLAMWGILLGVGLAQRVWELRNGRWLGIHRPYDVRNLRWDSKRRLWAVRTDKGEVDIVRGDRRWVLYAPSCSGQPEGDERPWMYGAWRACARPWLGKHLAWGDWQHHQEVHGSPIRTADLSEDKPPSQTIRDSLCNALADIGADTAIVPPPGAKLRLLEAAGNTWLMFPGSIDAASREMVIAITGQASSTEVQSGQETGATLHGEVRRDLINADAETLSSCLYEQSLRDYTALNFGTEELTPYPRWETEPASDGAALGGAMSALSAGILAADKAAPEGERVDRRAAYERAGIVFEKIPRDAVQPVPADPAPVPAEEPSE